MRRLAGVARPSRWGNSAGITPPPSFRYVRELNAITIHRARGRLLQRVIPVSQLRRPPRDRLGVAVAEGDVPLVFQVFRVGERGRVLPRAPPVVADGDEVLNRRAHQLRVPIAVVEARLVLLD